MFINQQGNNVSFDVYENFTVTFQLTVTNACSTIVSNITETYLVNSDPPYCARRRPAPSTQNDTFFRSYPNPTNNIINIELKTQDLKPNPNSIINAEIYNMMGEVKKNVLISNNVATLDVVGLLKGIYILKITVDGVTESHQVAIQ